MLAAGSLFAHFKIIRQLGQGGMGIVYLAEDQKLKREIALKILSADIFDDDEHRERFHREARTAASVTHSNVMAIYDIGSAPDPDSGRELNYIVMEHIKGISLGRYLSENKPDLAGLIRLAEKTAAGLAAAHQMKIVHRDIKPDNILVDAEGNPKILDFGLAKPVDPLQTSSGDDSANTISQELTKAGKIVGTVKYMSPEQVQGKPVDSRSDIFSFGILLYIMCSGETPFVGQTQVSTMAKILESRQEPLSRKVPDIPPELDRIIDKCLHKDVADRYQDSRDLVVDLRNLRRGFDSGVTSSYSSITDQPSAITKSISSRRIWEPLTGAFIVLTAIVYLLGGFDSFLPGQKSTSAVASGNSLAIISFENKTGNTELDWLESGLPEILLTDLSRNQEIGVISQRRILDCFDDDRNRKRTYTECAEMALSLGASRILSGSFYKLGDKIRIDARLEEIVTGKILMGEKVSGADPFALVDSITVRIAKALEMTVTEKGSALAHSTPEAFKAYHLGVELFWANEFDSAIVKLNEAITLDSTFALPLLRLGMAYQFSGKPAQASQYFKMAQQHQDRLPTKERSLLDAYYDTWVAQQFDHAFVKLEGLLTTYPDDAEIRSMYALFIEAFRADTATAFAHLDTVLAKYPAYPFAIFQYAALESQNGNTERAAELTEHLISVLPNSLAARVTLVALRQAQNRYDEALTVAQDLHARFESDKRPIVRLISINTHLRKFDQAKQWVEKLWEIGPEDNYNLFSCYSYLANIETWKGKFYASIEQLKLRLDIARATGDSAYVFVALNGLSDQFLRFEMSDSVLHYNKLAFDWATGINRINYPVRLIELDPTHEPLARPIFDSFLTSFRAQLPREFWGAADGQQEIFDGHATHDTTLLISGHRRAIQAMNEQRGDATFGLGQLLVLTGTFEEGKELLLRFVEGQYRTNGSNRYQKCQYLIGRANEALGLTSEAVENYQQFLKFWGNADIQIKSIIDAKERLARLRS